MVLKRPLVPSIGESVVRWRAVLCFIWIAVVVALVPLGLDLEQKLQVRAEIDGSESLRAESILKQQFDSPFASTAIVTVTGIEAPASPAGSAALRAVVKEIASTPGVAATSSYLDGGDPFFIGQNGTGTFFLAGFDSRFSEDATISSLHENLHAAESKLLPSHPGLILRLTGAAALNADLRRVSAEEAQRAELWAMPVILGLLLLAFGTFRAAALPVISGLLAIALALGAIGVAARHWALSILIVNVVTMIGLGLSIDYALLMVGRFKEAQEGGRDKREAAIQAARHAGKTIVISGLAVAMGFAGLLLMPLNELRSIAIGGVVVVTFAILLATTLVPGCLSWFGVSGKDTARRPAMLPQPKTFWSWWGTLVCLYPKHILLLAAVPVLALSFAATRITTEIPRDDWLPQNVDSVRAIRDLGAMGRHNIIETIRVIVQLPVAVEEERGWRAIAQSTEVLTADPRVAQVRSVSSLLPPTFAGGAAVRFLPEPLRRSLISRDGKSALLEIVPRESSSPADLIRFARELRAIDARAVTGMNGALLTVGGIPSFDSEYVEVVTERLPAIILLVVLGTFVVFALAYRSVLIPVKAIALNLLSVTASLGAVVLVFQDGFGAGLLGVSAPIGGVFPIIPPLVFCTVFGLSIDYEAFLLSRLAEARVHGSNDGAALREALTHTGGVITSAALIMITVFAAFMLGDFVLIKMLGFALVVAVLIDATLVRLALGPALIMISGRWNWWPGERLEAAGGTAVTIAARAATDA